MDTSYLAQQVTTIIGQLHGLYDEIGVPNHERDSREAEVHMYSYAQLFARQLTRFSSSLRCPTHSTASCALLLMRSMS